jgi:hypothetical protein
MKLRVSFKNLIFRPEKIVIMLDQFRYDWLVGDFCSDILEMRIDKFESFH